MSRWLLPVVVAVVVVCVAGVLLQFWFGGIARGQAELDAEHARRNDELLEFEAKARRGERSLEVWSEELEKIDEAATIRARELAAAALLDRALGGDKPVQQEVRL